jgi:hypothetical protein
MKTWFRLAWRRLVKSVSTFREIWRADGEDRDRCYFLRPFYVFGHIVRDKSSTASGNAAPHDDDSECWEFDAEKFSHSGKFGEPLNILGSPGFNLRRRYVSPDGQTVRFSDKPIDGFIELSNVAFLESSLSVEEFAKRAN